MLGTSCQDGLDAKSDPQESGQVQVEMMSNKYAWGF
jgi:hypothetical protein